MSKVVCVRALLSGQVAENTILLYAEGWNRYVEFAGTFVKAIDASTLVRFRQHMIAEKGYSASTVNSYLKGVKRVAKELYALKEIDKLTNLDIQEVAYLPNNALLERRRPHNKVHVEPEQMSALCRNLEIATPLELRDRALLFTLATTGCRISEVLHMRVQDIKQLSSSNYVVTGVLGKWQGEPRNVPLSVEAHAAIQEWLAVRPVESVYIFTGVTYTSVGEIVYHGEPLKRQTAGHRIKECARQMGIDHLKAHDFRRFVATQLIKNNGIRIAQKVLGHANISTTAQYDTESFPEGVTANIF